MTGRRGRRALQPSAARRAMRTRTKPSAARSRGTLGLPFDVGPRRRARRGARAAALDRRRGARAALRVPRTSAADGSAPTAIAIGHTPRRPGRNVSAAAAARRRARAGSPASGRARAASSGRCSTSRAPSCARTLADRGLAFREDATQRGSVDSAQPCPARAAAVPRARVLARRSPTCWPARRRSRAQDEDASAARSNRTGRVRSSYHR